MSSTWTNLSFAIIHRDLEREWENHFGVMSIIFCYWRFLLTLRRSIHLLKFWRGWGVQILIQYKYCFGASRSKWAMELVEHGLTSRIALLVCFIVWFCFLFYIVNRVHEDDNWTPNEEYFTSCWMHHSHEFYLWMQKICNGQSSGVKYEWTIFSHNLCWQPTLRYKRTGGWRFILQGCHRVIYYILVVWIWASFIFNNFCYNPVLYQSK